MRVNYDSLVPLLNRSRERVETRLSTAAWDLMVPPGLLQQFPNQSSPQLVAHHPDHCVAHIQDQLDHNLINTIRQLSQRKKELTLQLARIRSRVRKSNYERVVRMFSRTARQYLTVRPYQYVEVPSPAVWAWEHQVDARWISKKEFLVQLRGKARTAKLRAKYSNAIAFLTAHPQLNTPKYRRVVVKDVWIKRIVFEEGYFGTIRKPVRAWMVKPIRNWARIHEYWSPIVYRVRKQAQPVRVSLDDVRRRLDDAFRRLRGGNRPVVLEQLQSQLQRDPEGVELGMKPDFLHKYWECYCGYDFRYENLERQYTIVQDSPARSLEELADEDAGKEPLKGPARHLYWHYNPSSVSEETEFCPLPAASMFAGGPQLGWVENFTTGKRVVSTWGNPAETVHLLSSDTSREETLSKRPLVLDLTREANQELRTTFDNRCLVAWSRLRNLRVGSRSALSRFSLLRSIAEQKDIPLTVKSGREVLAWLRQHKDRPVLRVVRNKREHLISAAAGKRYDQLLAWSRLPLGRRERAYKLANITSVSRYIPRTLPALCTCYLAWKFGIEQSLNDAWFLCNHAKKYMQYVRHELAQYKSVNPASRELSITPRSRCFVATNRGLSWNPRKPLDNVIDPHGREPWSGLVETYEDDFDFDRSSYERVVLGRTIQWVEGMSLDQFCIRSRKGLYRLSPLVSNPIPDEVRLDIAQRNLAILAENKFTPCAIVHVGRMLRGSVYSKLTLEGLTRALEASWSNIMERLRPLETTWELVPLSFITEWFLNTRDFVEVAQNNISRVATKVASQRPWEALAERYFYAIEDYTGKFTMDTSFEPTDCFAIGQIVESYNPTQGFVTQPETRWCHYNLIPDKVKIRFEHHPVKGDAPTWVRSNVRSFVRQPSTFGDFSVPKVQVRMNINTSKLLSLFAIGSNSF